MKQQQSSTRSSITGSRQGLCQVRHRGVSHALGHDLFQKPVANAGEFVVIHAAGAEPQDRNPSDRTSTRSTTNHG